MYETSFGGFLVLLLLVGPLIVAIARGVIGAWRQAQYSDDPEKFLLVLWAIALASTLIPGVGSGLSLSAYLLYPRRVAEFLGLVGIALVVAVLGVVGSGQCARQGARMSGGACLALHSTGTLLHVLGCGAAVGAVLLILGYSWMPSFMSRC